MKPLEPHGCGTLLNNSMNGGPSIDKKLDARCILRMVKEEDQVAAGLVVYCMTEEQCGIWISKLIEDNRLEEFYNSKEWRKIRKEILKEYKKQGCIDCKKHGFYSKATTVHHQQYVRQHPRLALTTQHFQKKV